MDNGVLLDEMTGSKTVIMLFDREKWAEVKTIVWACLLCLILLFHVSNVTNWNSTRKKWKCTKK